MAAQVKDNLSNELLSQFHISIGTNLMNKIDEWPSRQRIQYESMKGLLALEWLSLADWQQQIGLYSSTHIILRAAHSVISNLIPRNQLVRTTLTNIPGLGLVGNFLLSLTGFRSLFIASQDVLSNNKQLKSTIKELT